MKKENLLFASLALLFSLNTFAVEPYEDWHAGGTVKDLRIVEGRYIRATLSSSIPFSTCQLLNEFQLADNLVRADLMFEMLVKAKEQQTMVIISTTGQCKGGFNVVDGIYMYE